MTRMVSAARRPDCRLISRCRWCGTIAAGNETWCQHHVNRRGGCMGVNQPVRLHRHRGKAVVLLAAATLIAAACGSDKNSGSSATAAPGTNAAAGATTAAATATTAAATAGTTSATTAGATGTTAAVTGGETSVTDYIAYSGGKAGAAD